MSKPDKTDQIRGTWTPLLARMITRKDGWLLEIEVRTDKGTVLKFNPLAHFKEVIDQYTKHGKPDEVHEVIKEVIDG